MESSEVAKSEREDRSAILEIGDLVGDGASPDLQGSKDWGKTTTISVVAGGFGEGPNGLMITNVPPGSRDASDEGENGGIQSLITNPKA